MNQCLYQCVDVTCTVHGLHSAAAVNDNYNGIYYITI